MLITINMVIELPTCSRIMKADECALQYIIIDLVIFPYLNDTLKVKIVPTYKKKRNSLDVCKFF